LEANNPQSIDYRLLLKKRHITFAGGIGSQLPPEIGVVHLPSLVDRLILLGRMQVRSRRNECLHFLITYDRDTVNSNYGSLRIFLIAGASCFGRSESHGLDTPMTTPERHSSSLSGFFSRPGRRVSHALAQPRLSLFAGHRGWHDRVPAALLAQVV
jgi:hypothetical protein